MISDSVCLSVVKTKFNIRDFIFGHFVETSYFACNTTENSVSDLETVIFIFIFILK